MNLVLRVLRSSATATMLSIALAGIVQEMVYRGIERTLAQQPALPASQRG